MLFVHNDSAAEDDGVKVGDRLIELDGEHSLSTAFDRFTGRGAAGKEEPVGEAAAEPRSARIRRPRGSILEPNRDHVLLEQPGPGQVVCVFTRPSKSHPLYADELFTIARLQYWFLTRPCENRYFRGRSPRGLQMLKDFMEENDSGRGGEESSGGGREELGQPSGKEGQGKAGAAGQGSAAGGGKQEEQLYSALGRNLGGWRVARFRGRGYQEEMTPGRAWRDPPEAFVEAANELLLFLRQAAASGGDGRLNEFEIGFIRERPKNHRGPGISEKILFGGVNIRKRLTQKLETAVSQKEAGEQVWRRNSKEHSPVEPVIQGFTDSIDGEKLKSMRQRYMAEEFQKPIFRTGKDAREVDLNIPEGELLSLEPMPQAGKGSFKLTRAFPEQNLLPGTRVNLKMVGEKVFVDKELPKLGPTVLRVEVPEVVPYPPWHDQLSEQQVRPEFRKAVIEAHCIARHLQALPQQRTRQDYFSTPMPSRKELRKGMSWSKRISQVVTPSGRSTSNLSTPKSSKSP